MNIGKIVQVIGNVVDVEFPEGKLPEILIGNCSQQSNHQRRGR